MNGNAERAAELACQPAPFDPPPKGWLERALAPIADVNAGEAGTVLLLAFDVWLLLCAYYLLKSAREPLILVEGGAEVKAYASAGQAALLVAVTQGYSLLARRFGRMRLISIVTLFFVSNLVGFFALGRAHIPIGIAFYLWVGVFNVTLVAQLWGLAADVFTPDQGKRLFAIVGLGSSVGALTGARVAKRLFVPLGPYGLMLVAACLLLACLGIAYAVHRRESRRESRRSAPVHADVPIGSRNGFTLVMADRYLLLLAALTVLLNCVNTTGEYVLDRTLVAAATTQGSGMSAHQFIGTFKAGYFGWVNLIGLLIQLFLVSRVLKYLGVRVALFALPLVALGGYTMLGLVPVLSLVAVAKIAENSLDYSVQNTARQALFLVVSREAKYTAKSVIDTFVVRMGDVLAALIVWVGSLLHVQTRTFAWLNVGMVLAWIAIVRALGREHQRRTQELHPSST